MAYVTTEVEIDLNSIADYELVDELESRGYIVIHSKEPSSISYLYSTYLTASKDAFDKELKKFFRETIDAKI
jgi:hypothetical protein